MIVSQAPKTHSDLIAHDTCFISFCPSICPTQAELVVAYVMKAFTALGCPLASLGVGHRLPDIHHSPKHAKLVGQLYNILEDADLIMRNTGATQRTEKSCPAAIASFLQAALLEKYPQHASEHQMRHVTGHKQTDCSTGHRDPLSLLFRDTKARILPEDICTKEPKFESGSMFLAQYLVGVFRQFDSEYEIKVLELGAGTGGRTKYLVESLLCVSKSSNTLLLISPLL